MMDSQLEHDSSGKCAVEVMREYTGSRALSLLEETTSAMSVGVEKLLHALWQKMRPNKSSLSALSTDEGTFCQSEAREPHPAR